jgi:spermidine synthase
VLDGTWYCDGWDPNLKILHRVGATLLDETSAYQRVQIVDTPGFGRMLLIDGLPQAAESDEGVYARALVWPAVLGRTGEVRLLVTGGGDGHAAREALRFPAVRRVVVCDIDALVTRATRELMPFMWGEAAADPRLEVRHEDALAYLDAVPAGSFDVVISDITDPSGEDSASHHLYSEDYVRRIARALAPGGVCVAQAQELSVRDASHHQRLRALFARGFAHVRSAAVYVPSFGYPEGFLYASGDPATLAVPADVVTERLRAAGLADDPLFDAAVYEGMFALPPRVRQELSE